MTKRKAISVLKKLKNDETYGSAVEMAISALNKEIPKKPIEGQDFGCAIVNCPNCHGLLYDADWTISTQKKYHNSRCLCCGQKLTKPGGYLGEWSD